MDFPHSGQFTSSTSLDRFRRRMSPLSAACLVCSSPDIMALVTGHKGLAHIKIENKCLPATLHLATSLLFAYLLFSTYREDGLVVDPFILIATNLAPVAALLVFANARFLAARVERNMMPIDFVQMLVEPALEGWRFQDDHILTGVRPRIMSAGILKAINNPAASIHGSSSLRLRPDGKRASGRARGRPECASRGGPIWRAAAGVLPLPFAA